ETILALPDLDLGSCVRAIHVVWSCADESQDLPDIAIDGDAANRSTTRRGKHHTDEDHRVDVHTPRHFVHFQVHARSRRRARSALSRDVLSLGHSARCRLSARTVGVGHSVRAPVRPLALGRDLVAEAVPVARDEPTRHAASDQRGNEGARSSRVTEVSPSVLPASVSRSTVALERVRAVVVVVPNVLRDAHAPHSLSVSETSVSSISPSKASPKSSWSPTSTSS